MNLVTVFRSFDPMQAQLTRSRLEAAGFHAHVIHEAAALTTGGYSMAVGGVRVQVPEDEAREAREFLAGEPEYEE